MTGTPILPQHDTFPPQPDAIGMILTFMEFEGIVENGEFLVHDLALGRKLGFTDERFIRKIIKRRMIELTRWGTARHRVTPYVSGNGTTKDTTEFFLNRKQALLLVRYSEAPGADAVYDHMMTVFERFREDGHSLTAEQTLDRLAAEETAVALASEGAEIQLRKAAALEAEAQRIRDAALAIRATRNDRFALMSASSQMLAAKEPLQAKQTLFGRQMMTLSAPAAVLWAVYDAGGHHGSFRQDRLALWLNIQAKRQTEASCA